MSAQFLSPLKWLILNLQMLTLSGNFVHFRAIVPRLVCEVLTVWLANLMAYTLNEYVVPLTEGVVCSCIGLFQICVLT